MSSTNRFVFRRAKTRPNSGVKPGIGSCSFKADLDKVIGSWMRMLNIVFSAGI